MKNSRKHKSHLLKSNKQINLVLRLIMSITMATVITACGGGDDTGDSGDDGGGTNPPPPLANLAPNANAGTDITVDEETTVSLLGSATDSDGSIASYAWTQTTGTTVTLTGLDTAVASFNTPETDKQHILTFQLTATDNDGATASDTVIITVNPIDEADIPLPEPLPEPLPDNISPTADAGSDITADEEAAVSLLGIATDSDGSIESYAWSQTAGTLVTLTDADEATVSFITPVTDEQLTLTFQLTATDNEGATTSDTVSITVNPIGDGDGDGDVTPPSDNISPAVDAGRDITANENTAVSLLGSATDADGSIESYAWSQTAGTIVTLTGADEATVSFHTPETDEQLTLTFQLTATDNEGATTSDTVSITVNNKPSTILLPVEVIGENETTVSRTFDLEDAVSAVSLWVQVNNLSYDNKASIRINEGAWTSITNGSVAVQEPEKTYGGIGSEVSTVRFSLPSNDFVKGSNTVDFRFNEHDGLSIGYRVVKFNVLDAGNSNLIPESDFINEDPDTWQAPIAGSTAITKGKLLYETAQLIFPGTNTNMNAKCMDCHLSTGFDLEYFSYSNHSIIERAKYHGLSQIEGEEIASYIRSLSTPRYGRPWNPPYQPGAELNGKTIDQWAAGAGLAAVLEADTDMEPYLFPNGTSQAAVNAVVEFDSVLDVTELPIAVQLPDWKSWLPEVHGKDLWPQNYFLNGDANQSYVDITNTLVNATPAQLVASGDAKELTNSFLANVKSWISQGRDDINNGRTDAWGTRVGTVVDARNLDYGYQYTKMNLTKWMAVKFFEIMHEHELEYLADKDPNVPLVDPVEGTRQWPGTDRTVFEVAPHFTAHNEVNFPWQTSMEGKYMSSVWYQLQMLLHSGEHNQLRKGGPMDWSYHFLHIYDMEKQGGPTEGFRQITSLMKLYQTRSNEYVPNDLELGWRMRYVHLWWMISSDMGDESAMLSLNNNDSNLRAKIYNAVINEWVDEVRKHDLATWPRETGHWTKLDPEDYVPSEDNIVGINKRIFAGSKQLHADYFVRALPMLADAGVDPATLHRLAQWCSEAWPKGNWFDLI